MQFRVRSLISLLIVSLSACNSGAATQYISLTAHASATNSVPPTQTLTPLPTNTPLPTATITASPIPTVPSLNAVVTTDLLSCRYGPGSEYLYLYALRRDARIKLVGQTGGSNWVWVESKTNCWVNAKFIEISGDLHTLPIVYPAPATLPVSPYYPPTHVLRAIRAGTQVTVTWIEIPLRPGDEEDASMLHYIIEVWRCEAGQIIFDPLATNDAKILFTDEPGCAAPSHGRIFVQEKHGFAGPAEIPWPSQ